jgi:organic radical activating enzyme
MSAITSIDLAIDVNHRPSFIVDWELTFLCNLDCSYCVSHDNNTKHPELERCKKGIDFIFKYVDLVMSIKKSYEKSVTLNLLGGETLIRPDIVEILEYMSELYNTTYKDRWKLTTYVTTNGIVGKSVLKKCLSLIQYWTVSYHTEALDKQKKMAVETIYLLKKHNKSFDVRLMAHSNPTKFKECQDLAKQFDQDGIKNSIKPIGATQSHVDVQSWNNIDSTNIHTYTKDQSEFIANYWNNRNKKSTNTITLHNMTKVDKKFVVTSAGYPCCSEKTLCVNSDRKNTVSHVPITQFQDWYCSVNWYFLFVKQNSELIYHNTSCRVNPETNLVEPIGTLSDGDLILKKFKHQLDTNTVPVVKCPKNYCGCGICAPKAKSKEDFEKIIKIHIDETVLKY